MMTTTTRPKQKSNIQSHSQLLELGKQNDWDARLLGYAPMPTTHTWIDKWLIVPAHLDSSPIPKRATQRIQRLFEEGIRPQGFVVVHEAPPLLKPGKEITPIDETKERETPEKPPRDLLKAGAGILGAAAVLSGVMVLAVAAVAMLLPALLIAGAVLVDPILVAVMEDNSWIEIDRWDVE